MFKLEPLSLSPVVRSNLFPLAGKDSWVNESKLLTSPGGWRCFTALKLERFRICLAASPRGGHLSHPVSPYSCMLVAHLLSLSHFRLVGHLVRPKMIITFGYSASFLGGCSKAWEFGRPAASELWNPFILENCKGIQHLMR